MFRKLVRSPQSLNYFVRHGTYWERPVKRDPTNKTDNSDIAWSTNETDTTTLERDKYKMKYPYKSEDGGINYFGFTYYPRFENEVDPPVTPSPLLMVRRLYRLNGMPWWQKDVFRELGLNDKTSDVAIVKNTAKTNASLYKIKDKVKITPIKLPANFPRDANPAHCFLMEDGELKYNPSIKIDPKKLLPHPKYYTLRVDSDFTKQEMIKSWRDTYNLKLA